MPASTDHTTPTPAPARRDQIVEAAFRCVAAQGITGLRMRDVATAAGLNIATVHYYVPSKAELVRAVVEHAHARFAAYATPPATLSSPAQRLRSHLDDTFTLLRSDPALAQVLAEVAVESAHDPVTADIVAAAEQRWRRAVQAMLRPLPAPQTRQIAALVVLVVKGACLPPADPSALRAARRTFEDAVVATLTVQPAQSARK
jgi:AcrR family transcriptional regulator